MEKVLVALIAALSTGFGAYLLHKRSVRKEASADARADTETAVETDSAVVQLYFTYAKHAESRQRQLEKDLKELREECSQKERDLLMYQAQAELLKSELTRLKEGRNV